MSKFYAVMNFGHPLSPKDRERFHQSLRLRYEVYSRENGWEKQYLLILRALLACLWSFLNGRGLEPILGIERDRFDRRAIHLVQVVDGRVALSVRLILNAQRQLELSRFVVQDGHKHRLTDFLRLVYLWGRNQGYDVVTVTIREAVLHKLKRRGFNCFAKLKEGGFTRLTKKKNGREKLERFIPCRIEIRHLRWLAAA